MLSLSTFAQIKVINNKGTFFQIDTSKWELVGVDIYNKNQIGNVGVGTFPYNARFVIDNGNSTLLPAFKLKYPFSGAISDSLLTWNPADSTVRRINTTILLNNSWKTTGNAGTTPATNFIGTTDNQRLVFRANNTERMTILTSGNIGMGTATPSNRLHINATNPLRLEGLQTNTTDTNLLVTTSTGVIQRRGILNLLSGKAILSLNGLTNSIQTFAIGTTGTDFNIVSSGSSHTFNFPDASSANRGLLTNTDWITFNNKIGTVTATTPAAVTTVGTTATILNTNAYWNANQLQGKNISTTAPTNGQVLAWNDTTSQWVPTSSTLTSSNGIDIGYIVAWGSNTTPPDYLLPLSGGTYNWADFPHFQAFQTTHPSQFITNNGTTFTLKDINTSGRFLRGGLTANVDQNGSTAMPINPFVLNNYTHNHSYTDINETGNLGTVGSVFWGSTNAITSLSSSSSSYSTSDNTHTHTLSGGDTETRPINTSVIWCIKVKPTMTAGDIIINTGSTTTTVSNSIVNNQITTTVNGVSSTPVTLPTPEPAVVEIYDAAGTQTLTSSFANITFGSTNIADAGYTIGVSGSQITITTAGTYRVTYRITAEVVNNTSCGGEYQLLQNGSVVPGTMGYTYHHNNNRDKGTVTVVKLLTITANDVIKVQGRRYTAAGDITLSADGSSLIIERIK